eukprot:3112280-Pleurochrysis_carterae.AAC.5
MRVKAALSPDRLADGVAGGPQLFVFRRQNRQREPVHRDILNTKRGVRQNRADVRRVIVRVRVCACARVREGRVCGARVRVCVRVRVSLLRRREEVEDEEERGQRAHVRLAALALEHLLHVRRRHQQQQAEQQLRRDDPRLAPA